MKICMCQRKKVLASTTRVVTVRSASRWTVSQRVSVRAALKNFSQYVVLCHCYLRQRRRYMRLPTCLFCLSVSEITKKRLHGFGWNFACITGGGHGRTGQLLSLIRIIVQMPEPENVKVEDLSKSVKQAPHSEQATGHGMHCREILFTQRCSPGPRSFADRSTFLYDVRLLSYWASKLPNFRLLAYFPHTKPLKRQNDLEWPLSQISMSRYYSTSNNSQTVQDRAIVTMAD